MSDSGESIEHNVDSLVKKVTEAMQNVKKRHGGQYIENTARECEKTFGWDRLKTTLALQHTTERNLIRVVQVDRKISYRENDDKPKNICSRDNVNTAASQTDTSACCDTDMIEIQCTITTLATDFKDFKKHVCDELEAVKRRQDNLSKDEAPGNVGINYEQALIKILRTG